MKTLLAAIATLLCLGCSCDGKRESKKTEPKAETAKEAVRKESAPKASPEKASKANAQTGGDIRDDAIPGYKK